MTYGQPIRILHTLLALCVLTQIAVGELMDVPEVENVPAQTQSMLSIPLAFAHESHAAAGGVVEETLGFEVHEYLGLTIAALILIRLILAFTSVPGAGWCGLFPYLCAGGRKTLIEESKAQLAGWKQGKLAPPEEGETLARSVHGLIILAVSCMAITGVTLYFGWSTTAPQTELIELVAETHELIVGGLEALLLAHILAVFLHQRQGHNIIARIKPGPQ
ncbi:MAG: cytochrome b/b6 domain-containing protein [Mariprofundaceae bacterium]|nr:cytochrome b/b6 domain-containing protein [Mariprofundaceae bacterium]